MAATVQPALRFTLTADAIRDVCARPAVLLALGEAVPAGAVTCAADRRRAVGDGVLRALELAAALAEHGAAERRDVPLLEEAERRMWEPIPVTLARLLQHVGPDGLYAYWVVDGAARREAWRADTRRRRQERVEPLAPSLPADGDRDPIDLGRFRLDVERAVGETSRRTGLPDDLVYGVMTREVTYAEAGRRAGRSPNAIWMALARLQPDWRGVAQRGREAGLGGGVLVHVADRTDAAVRRVVRWRLVGGAAAAVLIALALAGVVLAAQLGGGEAPAREPVEPAPEAAAPGEGPWSQFGRLAALEAARRLSTGATRPSVPARPRTAASRTRRPAAAAASAAPPAGVPAAVPAPPAASCGFGTAALACR